MFTLFVTLVLVVAMLGTVGWAVFTFQRSSELTSLAQRNASRMEGMAALMRASLKYDAATGAFMAPVGAMATLSYTQPDGSTTTLNRGTLPTQVVGDDHTPWGGQYGFCPLAVSGGANDGQASVGADTLTDSHGTKSTNAYQVGYRALLDDHGQPLDYVSSTTWANGPQVTDPGIVGFIVSPVPFKGGFLDMPNCSDIKTSKSNPSVYVVSGATGPVGSVVPVSGAGLVKTQTLAQVSSPVIFVAPGQGGDGSGRDAADPMPLSLALAYWHDNFPTGTTFVLGNGKYQVTADQVNMALPSPGVAAPDVAGSRSYVAFEGPPTGQATFVAQANTTPFVLGVNAQFDGAISFDPSVPLMVGPGVSASLRITGSLGVAMVENGTLVTTSPSVGTLALQGARASVVLASPSYPAPSSNAAVTVANLAAAGGGVSLSSVDVTLGNTPSFSPLSAQPTVAFENGATVTLANVKYAASPAFVEAVTTTTVTSSASQCATDSTSNTDVTCTATCPVPNPYAFEGGCSVDPADTTTSTLAGTWVSPPIPAMGSTAAQSGSRSCRWHPGLAKTASVEVGGASSASVSGVAITRCSAFPR